MKHEFYILIIIIIILILVYLTMVTHARLSGRTFHEDLLPSMYQGEFPEDEFSTNDPNYHEEVEKGKKIAAVSTLCIGGLAYNLTQEQINKLRKRLDYIGQGWERVKIYVYGLDSKEPFRSVLIDWSNNDSRVELIPPLDRSFKGVSVFTKMSHLRHTLHQAMLKEDAYYLTIDYDIGGPISRDGLFHALYVLNSDKSIGAVYANGIVSDSFINTIPGLKGWCFPALGYCYYDDLACVIDSIDESKLSKWIYMTRGRGSAPVEIKSAYGGAGLYRKESLLQGSYDLEATSCEHHSFNASLINKGFRVVVDPSFLLLAGCQGHHITRKID